MDTSAVVRSICDRVCRSYGLADDIDDVCQEVYLAECDFQQFGWCTFVEKVARSRCVEEWRRRKKYGVSSELEHATRDDSPWSCVRTRKELAARRQKRRRDRNRMRKAGELIRRLGWFDKGLKSISTIPGSSHPLFPGEPHPDDERTARLTRRWVFLRGNAFEVEKRVGTPLSTLLFGSPSSSAEAARFWERDFPYTICDASGPPLSRYLEGEKYFSTPKVLSFNGQPILKSCPTRSNQPDQLQRDCLVLSCADSILSVAGLHGTGTSAFAQLLSSPLLLEWIVAHAAGITRWQMTIFLKVAHDGNEDLPVSYCSLPISRSSINARCRFVPC